MSDVFRAIHVRDVAGSIEEVLLPRLTEALQGRVPGHCMRVSDLDSDLMAALAKALRSQATEANVHVLTDDGVIPDDDLYISSTKLVELRNPLPDGTLRPPLCVFLPANLRTSAEDSFGSATFEEFPVGDIYDALRLRLLERIPSTLRGSVQDVLQLLREERWRWADSAVEVRYLLCAQANGNDAEAFGAALYELGLVPDFNLFDQPTGARGRVRKNHECLRRLTDGDTSVLGRVLQLDLANQGMRRRLAEYLDDVGLEDPVAWTRNIVLDRKNWDLSFDKWEFEAEIAPEKIAFVQVETDLPVVADDEHENERLADLIGQQVLLPGERRKLNVTIEVIPHPRQVRGLDHFTVQIISREAGPVGATRKLKVWKVARTHASVSLAKLNQVAFEEGWHHVRVLPWTADGDPIPLDEPGDQTAKRTNESEPFYVLPGAELEEEPPQRAVPRADSVEHARLDRQFAAVTQDRDPTDIAPHSIDWTQRSTAKRAAAQEIVEAKFGKEGTLQILVARWLKTIEQRVLAEPDRPVSWRMQIHAGQPHTPTGDIPEWTRSAATGAFLDARSAYFKVVTQDTGNMVSQGLDVLSNRAMVLAYAASYVELLKDLATRAERETGADQLNSIVSLRTALAVDTVRLVVEDYRGQVREAALVAPTHPLRALWHLAWSLLGAAWVREAPRAGREHVGPARDALLHGLSSINFPAMLPVSDGRVFTAVDNIHPFWPLYAPAGEDDPRGLLGDVCAALGVPEPSIGGAAVTGNVLASRIERYLIQHPYVRTLTINAFNPGRATVLADALAALQRQEAYQDLRYDVRLFVPDPNAPGVGESIDTLLAGGGTSASEAFSIPTGSRIFPKLTVAVRATADFRSDPDRFRCHLSILFDVFPPEEMTAGRPLRTETTIPLHGLVQEFTTRFHDDTGGTWWRRQPRHGTPVPIEGGEEASILLGELPALISSATATVARSTPDSTARPIIRLELASAERALINEVHDASDWVFTIDRNMGIEFFDHGGRRDRPDYLIDYTPSTVPEHGHRLIISSRSLAELEAILRPVLGEYGLDMSERHAVVMLDQLRSLSGRLALKLVSGPTARAEAMGLALARMFLEYQGALRNQIVVPLDAHIDLFRTVQSQAEKMDDQVTLHRTDLALFDLDLAKRTVSCNLVEVKCCAQRLGLSGYGQLKERITHQINQSERVLQRHFDPHRTTPDRPDRLLKTRELATLLDFYLERGLRYRLIEREAAEEARALLDRLEDGYRLQFSRSGLVFDFDKPGTEPPEHEVDIEFHRIGVDLIQELVKQAAAEGPECSPADGGDDSGDGGTVRDATQEAAPEIRPVASIPRLDSAAFLVADRPRSTSELDDWPRADQEDDIVPVGNAQQSEAADGSSQAVSGEPAKIAVAEPVPSGGPPSSEDGAETVEEVVPSEPVSPPVDSHSQPQSMGEVELPIPDVPRTPNADGLGYDAILGVTGSSPQYGLLGETSGRKIALDLNQTHTISLFGVQGGGK
ncbi:MAG: ATP-binding protein, partial [Gammaproteobacteria bacterium]|nr:ATP-binding protein [Gammaproteobacteria bacterium]